MEKMTERQFYHIVEQMRVAQREYARTYSLYYKEQAQLYARQVDDAIKRYNKAKEEVSKGTPLPF